MNTAINHQQSNLQVHQVHPHQTQARQILTRMTEVIIPESSNSNNIIFPLVASMTKQKVPLHLSKRQERWVTWITDRKPDYQQLQHFGANAEFLRIIHINKNNDNRWIIWDALNTGNSHTVIADINTVDNHDVEKMELAAETGKCTGMLVRSL